MSRARATSLAALAVLAAAATPALALPDGWSAPTTLSGARVSGLQPVAAADARGDLAVAWRARSPEGEVLQLSTRLAGAAAFSPPLTLGPVAVSVQGVRIAIAARGRVIVGWRTRGHGGHSSIHLAFVSASGRHISKSTSPFALDASGAVAVAFTRNGAGAYAWIAEGPRSTDDPPFDGRVQIGFIPGAGTRHERLIFPSLRIPRTSVSCLDESGVELAARPDGGVTAWWDCDDDIRDYVTVAVQISPTGALGKLQEAGGVSRGASHSAIQPGPNRTALGVQSVNNDDDQGPNVGLMARSPAGRWTGIAPTISNIPVDPFALPPHILGAPRIAAATGIALAAWQGDEGRVTVVTGSTATTTWDPAFALTTTGDGAIVAGVGVTNAHSLQAVFSTRTAPGPARTLWSERRLAGDPAFGAPEQALVIPRLTGEPSFALGRGGRGVVVWSQGPSSSARVRAAVVQVP